MGLLDKKKSLLTDEQSHWGDVANRLGADISNYGGSALRGLLKGTVGLPVGLHNLVSDVTGRGSQIDTLSPEWVGKKVEPYLPAGNTKTEIGGEFINPLGVMKAASIPLMGLMFAGKGAKTADLFKLREAEEMLKKGASDRDAYAKTGWTHGFADKKPRFEIDDSNSAIDENVVGAIHSDRGAFQGRMEDALNHPELYDNYDLGNIQASIYASRNPKGSYDRATRTIEVGAPSSGKQKRTALHELDHAIQNKEGFAGGGSPERFIDKDIENKYARKAYNADRYINLLTDPKSIGGSWDGLPFENKLKYLNEARFKAYRNLAGEASSRLTEKRMNMTAAERAKSYPPDMFDVPVEDQIVSFGDGKQMMSEVAPKGLLGKKKLTLEEKENLLNNLKASSPEKYNRLVKGANKRKNQTNQKKPPSTERLYSFYRSREAFNKKYREEKEIERIRKERRDKIIKDSGIDPKFLTAVGNFKVPDYLKEKGFVEGYTSSSRTPTGDPYGVSSYYTHPLYKDLKVRYSDHAPVNQRSNLMHNFYPDSHYNIVDKKKNIDEIIERAKKGLPQKHFYKQWWE